ncbi:CCHC-type domain-containing protein [Trichonephila clavata]|uniref:CCHC-type domain-containing protein n=1 Tax=Trichonephila clavata TaxID=2740835 RepID=A0A8X6IQG9_TRICU|nr:CCHC-type domain-containing protein [Trichonephila clavata]
MHSDAPVKLSDSLALVPSSFGWILSGSRSHATVSFNPTIHSINVDTLTHELDNMVRNFWNLESIGTQRIEAVLKDTQNEVRLFYLPHHAVKKITNEQIKWRIVFDASYHSPGHPSLNDTLGAGPNLLPDILAMLLRFRLSKIAITSDGSQAFLQLILADEDRDATRFLWYKTEHISDGNLYIADEIVTYRFTRLLFRLTSSPFLLSASLRELATMYKQTYPIATKHIENNIYMDDFVIGTSTDTEAITLYREMLQLTSHISLPLAKWTSNSKTLQGVWKQENIPFREITQVLGVKWRHCTGTDNPADHLTRGTFPSQLPSLGSWRHGPKWLNHDSEAWPTKDFPSHSQPSVEVESRKTESRSFYVATTEPIIDISRYSSYTKLLRVTV